MEAVTRVLAVLVPFALAGAALGQPAPPRTVRVEGFGSVISGDVAAARDEAIADARLRAVEQVAGVQLDGSALVANELLVDSVVSSRTLGQVSALEVLEEGPVEGGLYRVLASVTVDPPAEAALAPGHEVSLLVEGADADLRDAVDAALRTRLASEGIASADEAARRIVVRLESSGDEELHTNLHARRVHGAARVDGQGAGVAAEATGFGQNARKAAAQGAAQLAERLVEALLADTLTGSSRRVRVEITGLPDLAAYRRVAALLRAIRWTTAVDPHPVGFQAGRGVWTVQCSQKGAHLATRLDREPDLEVVSFDPRSVHARLTAPVPQGRMDP